MARMVHCKKLGKQLPALIKESSKTYPTSRGPADCRVLDPKAASAAVETWLSR